jgi:hypothetical protein
MSVKWTRVVSLLAAAGLGGGLVVAAQVAARTLRPGPANHILAVVDGKPITVQALQREILLRGGEAAFSTPEQRRALLGEMIRVAVLASNAQKSGLTDDPDVRRAMDQLLADRYQHDRIDAPLVELQVGDGDIEDYYRAHIGSFTTPRAVHAAAIFIAMSPAASDDERQRLHERAERVHGLASAGSGGPSFAELAAEYSDDEGTRSQGGDLGWLIEGEQKAGWDPALQRAILTLDGVGQITPVTVTSSGYAIARLIEERPAALQPLTEARNAIRQQLTREQRQQRAGKLYAQALANVEVSVNEAAVTAMDAAAKAVVDIPRASAQPNG